MKSTAVKSPPKTVQIRIYVAGQVIEATIPGPLVALKEEATS